MGVAGGLEYKRKACGWIEAMQQQLKQIESVCQPKTIVHAGPRNLFVRQESEQAKQIQQTIDIYMSSAGVICRKLAKLGYKVFGGTNAPYIWVQTPKGVGSWEFFDLLLNKANVVCTPGAGFGPAGEGYVRLTAFATPDNVNEAMKRLAKL